MLLLWELTFYDNKTFGLKNIKLSVNQFDMLVQSINVDKSVIQPHKTEYHLLRKVQK